MKLVECFFSIASSVKMALYLSPLRARWTEPTDGFKKTKKKSKNSLFPDF